MTAPDCRPVPVGQRAALGQGPCRWWRTVLARGAVRCSSGGRPGRLSQVSKVLSVPHAGQGCSGSWEIQLDGLRPLLGGHPSLSTQQARSEQQPVTGSRWGPVSSEGGCPRSPKGRVGHPGPDYQSFGDPPGACPSLGLGALGTGSRAASGGGLGSGRTLVGGGGPRRAAPCTQLLSVEGQLGWAGPRTPSNCWGSPALRVECRCSRMACGSVVCALAEGSSAVSKALSSEAVGRLPSLPGAF